MPLSAQPAPEPWSDVSVSGTCPDAKMVRTLLSTLVVPRRSAAANAPIGTVADLGAEFRVAVGSRSKSYADPARDCAQRARVAAAFIAIALLPEGASAPPSGSTPPGASGRSEPRPERPSSPSNAAPVETPARAQPAETPPRAAPAEAPTRGTPAETPPRAAPAETRARAASGEKSSGAPPAEPPARREGDHSEARTAPPQSAPGAATNWGNVDARGAFALGLPTALVAPGIAIRAAGGRGAFGGHATCGWFFGTPMALAGQAGTVLLERLPCAAGGTFRFFWLDRHFESAIDAGLAIGLLRAIGRGFVSTYASSRAEVGARIAVDAALHLDSKPATVTPVIGLEATAYATPYDFDVTPHGVVGRAPPVWSAVTLGVRWGVDFGP
ncbi:MAG TPA: hypothetical protein VEK07_03285 [Polyangiaceae bacterium]|nr:hypothetical protein [Polyangiaceae bacterium]